MSPEVPLLRPLDARLLLVCLTLIISLEGTWARQAAVAQDAPRPGRLSKDEIAALRPGVTLQFQSLADKPRNDRRLTRFVALHVPQQMPPTPFIPAGPFRATFSGYIKLPLRGDYVFTLAGRGAVEFRINDQTVVKAQSDDLSHTDPVTVALVKGYNKLECVYTSPATDDATFRLYWKGDGFLTEPVSPEVLFTRGDLLELVTALAQRDGRLLYATRDCHKCHVLPDEVRSADFPMPELQHTAPVLIHAGQRLEPEWLARWIYDPKSLQPVATMPRLFHQADDVTGDRQKAVDLAAYLETFTATSAPPTDRREDQALITQGRKLFENLACVACHHLKQPGADDPFQRRSLGLVGRKFRDGALAAFLQAPHAHYAWSAMPDFQLTADESVALAAFLRKEAQATLPDWPALQPGNRARGKELFAQAGCAHCHQLQRDAATLFPRLPFPRADRLDTGCLAEPARTARAANVPDFRFNSAEGEQLRLFLNQGGSSLQRDHPAEFAHRQMQSLQCTACHRRDGQMSKITFVIDEEGNQGLPAEWFPSLTWAGEKLQPDWTVKLFRGEVQQTRHWLKGRMPRFPVRADELAQGLTFEHGFPLAPEPVRPVDEKQVAIGKQLAGESGFSCIKCHPTGQRPALAPFEAPGINLAYAAGRLRASYYPRWMADPFRLDPAVKMPKLSADGKTTGLTQILNGNAPQQFDALWHYIQSLPGEGK